MAHTETTSNAELLAAACDPITDTLNVKGKTREYCLEQANIELRQENERLTIQQGILDIQNQGFRNENYRLGRQNSNLRNDVERYRDFLYELRTLSVPVSWKTLFEVTWHMGLSQGWNVYLGKRFLWRKKVTSLVLEKGRVLMSFCKLAS